MAFPTLYIDTGGHAQGSGSSDSGTPKAFGANGAAVSGTTVTLSGSPDLSGVAVDGSDTIYIADATNSNQKIFKITAVDNGAKTVTVDVAPTGSISNSAWGIGGRFVYDGTRFEGALAAGWTVILNNSPASKSADFFTARASGDQTNGPITFKGKTGVRPKLTVTNTNQCIDGTGNNAFWWFENLELEQQGGSGDVVNSTAFISQSVFKNIKISDGGGNGLGGTATRLIACEVSGVGSNGVNAGATTTDVAIIACHIHDNGADGVQDAANASGVKLIWASIFDSNAGRGMRWSSAAAGAGSMSRVIGNVVYGHGNSGAEWNDVEFAPLLLNNIFMNNGDASGEYNLEAVSAVLTQRYNQNNIIFQDGTTLGTGAANTSNYPLDASDINSDPLFVDAPNGDFRLQSGSPAKAAGFPGAFLGGPTGYLDIGAVQRLESGGYPASRTLLGM